MLSFLFHLYYCFYLFLAYFYFRFWFSNFSKSNLKYLFQLIAGQHLSISMNYEFIN